MLVLFGSVTVKVWRQGFKNTAFGYLEKTLASIIENGYEFLLYNETFMGLRDTEVIYPVLIEAYKNDISKTAIKRILNNRGISIKFIIRLFIVGENPWRVPLAK